MKSDLRSAIAKKLVAQGQCESDRGHQPPIRVRQVYAPRHRHARPHGPTAAYSATLGFLPPFRVFPLLWTLRPIAYREARLNLIERGKDVGVHRRRLVPGKNAPQVRIDALEQIAVRLQARAQGDV